MSYKMLLFHNNLNNQIINFAEKGHLAIFNMVQNYWHLPNNFIVALQKKKKKSLIWNISVSNNRGYVIIRIFQNTETSGIKHGKFA